MLMTRASALVKTAIAFMATMDPSMSSPQAQTPSGGNNGMQAKVPLLQEEQHKDPLLLRVARGDVDMNADEHQTPVWMMRQAGRHMKAYRDLVQQYPTFRERSETPDVSLQVSLQPSDAYGVDGVILFSDILTPLPAMGIDFSISEGGKITIDPIRNKSSLDRLERLKAHDYQSTCSFVGEVLGRLRKEVPSTSTVLGFIGLPFTLGSYVVEGQTGVKNGFPNIKEMIEKDPKVLHELLSLLAQNISEYAIYQINCGAQVLQVFDSWAGHMDDKAYAEFCIPYQKQVIQCIKRQHPTTPIIIYMAPGKFSMHGRRLAQLASTGADIVSVDHTVDMAVAKDLIPEPVGLQGNLDPILLRDGPVEDIIDQTRSILDKVRGRKHIMNLGHGIDPTTPEEHAALFVKTVQEYRRA